MTTLTQEQNETLTSFAQKRDALLADIKSKTQEFEKLSESVARLEDLLAMANMDYDALVAEKNGLRFDIGVLVAQKEDADNEFQKSKAEIATAKSELENRVEELQNTVAALGMADEIVRKTIHSITEAADGAKNNVSEYASKHLELISTFVAEVDEARRSLEAFRNDQIAFAKQNLEIRDALNERERLIQAREVAVDVLIKDKLAEQA